MKKNTITIDLDRLDAEMDLNTFNKQYGKYRIEPPCTLTEAVEEFGMVVVEMEGMATFAQYEREKISERTKEALAVRKLKGGKLGNPQYFSMEGRRKGAKAQKQKAEIKNRETMELIKTYRIDRKMTFQAIADKLNEIGHTTPTGRKFQKGTVKIMFDRLDV